MKHIITNDKVDNKLYSAYYYIVKYITELSPGTHCIYVDHTIFVEIAPELQWSFDGLRAWINCSRHGRVYIEKLSDELQALV